MDIIRDLRSVVIKEMVNGKSQIMELMTQINSHLFGLYELSNCYEYVQIALGKMIDGKWVVSRMLFKNKETREIVDLGDMLKCIDISDQNVLKFISLNYNDVDIHISERLCDFPEFTIARYLLNQIENKDKKIDTMMDIMENMI